VVIWLYDWFAPRYDDVKNYQRIYEHALLAQPIMDKVAPHTSPLVLDVATGTGRLPIALLNHSHFQGRVVAVDLSRRMLEIAAQKLANAEQVKLLWCPAETLPFSDNTFDVVTCLEALEFMADPPLVLRELVRVLRPGGLLLITNRINTRLMPGKTWTKERLAELLADSDIVDADVEAWQHDYHKVWAVKDGEAEPTGARPLGEILRCPCCTDRLMVERDGMWACEGCEGRARVAPDGVIELFPLQEKC
jgi:ubiquinone/menaquinone biosynthesis C-methylase UbiE